MDNVPSIADELEINIWAQLRILDTGEKMKQAKGRGYLYRKIHLQDGHPRCGLMSDQSLQNPNPNQKTKYTM